MALSLATERLRIRHWRVEDADAALAIYGVADVTGWLTPATNRVGDRQAMLSVLQTWVHDQPDLPPPRGRWAIERQTDGDRGRRPGDPAAAAGRGGPGN
jgi:hypothetical protein